MIDGAIHGDRFQVHKRGALIGPGGPPVTVVAPVHDRLILDEPPGWSTKPEMNK